MLKNGTLPGTHNLDPETKERALTKMRYGGMFKSLFYDISCLNNCMFG